MKKLLIASLAFLSINSVYALTEKEMYFPDAELSDDVTTLCGFMKSTNLSDQKSIEEDKSIPEFFIEEQKKIELQTAAYLQSNCTSESDKMSISRAVTFAKNSYEKNESNCKAAVKNFIKHSKIPEADKKKLSNELEKACIKRASNALKRAKEFSYIREEFLKKIAAAQIKVEEKCTSAVSINNSGAKLNKDVQKVQDNLIKNRVNAK